jgi:hypothetical protein
MRLRHLALAVVLIIAINAGITYGMVQWASPSGAQGPQGVQGIPGPVASADVNTTLCAAALSAQPAQIIRGNNPDIAANIAKYCP